ELFPKDAPGKSTAAHGYEYFVGFEFQFFFAFARGRDRAALLDFHRADFRLEMERHALGGQRFLKQVRQLEIETERDPCQELEHDHFRPEPAPDRPQLEADRAATDDQQFFRRFLERERFCAAHDDIAVKFHV